VTRGQQGQGSGQQRQHGSVTQGQGQGQGQKGSVTPGQQGSVTQGQQRQQGSVAQGTAAQGHVNAASATQRQGNADTHQQNGSVKILNLALFKENDKLYLKNGSVADTLTELVTSLLEIDFPIITFPNGLDDQSSLEKSAYICYAFYEIAMWKNQGLNNDNLPDVKVVGEAAVNRAIVVLTNNMLLIPEENKDKINEYITNIQGTVTPNVATVI